MAMENIMQALMQAATESQQPAASGQSAGADMLSQAVGSLLGGSSQGGGQANQLLGALEGIIGGQPGTGQPLPMNQGAAMNMGANDPMMMLLQPVVTQLAAKANISPQIAMVVASIALHYLLSSHPSTSPKAPMDLGSVMQQLASGKISPDTLHNSGMVKDVMQATGLNQQQAVKSLDATFGALGGHIQSGTNLRRSM